MIIFLKRNPNLKGGAEEREGGGVSESFDKYLEKNLLGGGGSGGLG